MYIYISISFYIYLLLTNSEFLHLDSSYQSYVNEHAIIVYAVH